MKKKVIPAICAAVLAVVIATAYCTRIDTVVYTGNTQYEESTLTRLIFGKFPNRIMYYLFRRSHASIPYIDSYTVRFNGTEADVQIREKTEVGYIRYMGANMYFDRYGTIVESTDEVYENVPEITGLQFDSVIVGQKIDTSQEMTLGSVLTFTQNLAEYNLPVSQADFTETGDIVLTMNAVTVQLGSTEHLSDKLYRLSALYPKLENLSGTLYLGNYDGTQDKIVFRDNSRMTAEETQTSSQETADQTYAQTPAPEAGETTAAAPVPQEQPVDEGKTNDSNMETETPAEASAGESTG